MQLIFTVFHDNDKFAKFNICLLLSRPNYITAPGVKTIRVNSGIRAQLAGTILEIWIFLTIYIPIISQQI